MLKQGSLGHRLFRLADADLRAHDLIIISISPSANGRVLSSHFSLKNTNSTMSNDDHIFIYGDGMDLGATVDCPTTTSANGGPSQASPGDSSSLHVPAPSPLPHVIMVDTQGRYRGTQTNSDSSSAHPKTLGTSGHPTVVSLRPRPLLAPSRGTPPPVAPQRLLRHWASSMVVTITDSLHSLLVYQVPECNHGFLDLPFHHPGHTLTHGLMDHNL